MRNRCHRIIYNQMVKNVLPIDGKSVNLTNDLKSVRKIFIFIFNIFAVRFI
ncbi:hypothetical protein MXB_1374 [Myxobolus squamalis]|nr:hypothetical protein MXB_1374 [Myxobolus squamalis]